MYTNIYIYICVCVCVCVDRGQPRLLRPAQVRAKEALRSEQTIEGPATRHKKLLQRLYPIP